MKDALTDPSWRTRRRGPQSRTAGSVAADACDRTGVMRFRIFTEPQEGATYDDQLAVAPARRGAGLRRLLPLRPLHQVLQPGRPARPHRRVDHARRSRPRHDHASGSAPWCHRSRSATPARSRSRVAQVDAMSGGRVELGLGAGWNDREHAAYGIPFPDTGERFDRLEEQLAIITGLWTTPIGGSFSFDGRALLARRLPRAAEAGAAAASADRDRRVRAKRTPRLAARYADEFNVAFAPPTRTSRRSSGASRAACEAIGRDSATLRSARRTRWSAVPTTPRSRGAPRRSGARPTQLGARDSRGHRRR